MGYSGAIGRMAGAPGLSMLGGLDAAAAAMLGCNGRGEGDPMSGRFATITVEKIGAVARLMLNRPERANALNAAMLGEIGTALDEIERDAGLRALVVTGAGTAFSSGFDLKEQMERRPVGVESWRAILRNDFDTIMRFWHFPLPTVATVRGPCL